MGATVMKKYIWGFLAAVVLLIGTNHLIQASESPYPDWFSNYWGNENQYVNSNNQITGQKIAHGTYSYAIDGGGTIGTSIPIHVTLPAKAVVSRVYYYVTTALVSAAAGNNGTDNMQLGCESGAEYKANADRIGATTAASFVEGIQTGSAATMTASSTSCSVALTVTSHSLSAGKVDFYINYSVSQ